MKDARKAPATALPQESLVAPIACYCVASVGMTLFVVSGAQFSMTFLLLCIQSIVCIFCVYMAKRAGIISVRSFDSEVARAWIFVSFMLVTVIYTGSKSLQYLSIPVFSIFKNLSIILIAYGEVIWFGGRVTSLTLISFIFMVLSSIIAAWADVTDTLADSMPASNSGLSTSSLQAMRGVVWNLNVGYFWMLINCFSNAAYVLSMRKRIKSTGFSDWDSMFYNNLLAIPILAVFSIIVEDWGAENLNINFPPETRRVLLSAIVLSGAAAVGISYTTAWCVRVAGSTTYRHGSFFLVLPGADQPLSMVGALNKLPVAASGIIFFNDPATFGSVSAIAVGFLSGIVYAIARKNQKEAERREEPIIPLSARKV
ncbi:UDP-galactose transporter [Mycena kentingensis (nom. inval.)]|nr:UDP-galactose transporter [Mycena kentingensis (nom. inval.)]